MSMDDGEYRQGNGARHVNRPEQESGAVPHEFEPHEFEPHEFEPKAFGQNEFENPAVRQAGAGANSAEPAEQDGFVEDEGVDVRFEVPQTGDPGLDETLRELARASAIPLEDQLPVIEAVHRSLQDRLADVEG